MDASVEEGAAERKSCEAEVSASLAPVRARAWQLGLRLFAFPVVPGRPTVNDDRLDPKTPYVVPVVSWPACLPAGLRADGRDPPTCLTLDARCFVWSPPPPHDPPDPARPPSRHPPSSTLHRPSSPPLNTSRPDMKVRARAPPDCHLKALKTDRFAVRSPRLPASYAWSARPPLRHAPDAAAFLAPSPPSRGSPALTLWPPLAARPLLAEEEAGHAAATNRGAVIYGASSTAAWFGLHSIAMRSSTFYRQRMPPSLKAAGSVHLSPSSYALRAGRNGARPTFELVG